MRQKYKRLSKQEMIFPFRPQKRSQILCEQKVAQDVFDINFKLILRGKKTSSWSKCPKEEGVQEMSFLSSPF